MEERNNCIEEITTLEEVDVISTGGTGTSDYNELNNKPRINNVELIENQTAEDLGLQPIGDYALKSDIPDTSDFATETYVDNKIQNLINNDIQTLDDLIEENKTNIANNKQEISELDDRVLKLEESSSGDFATEEYVNEKVQGLVDGDIANLTELITENQDNITQLQKADIASFSTSKPSSDGLVTINAVTKNNQNIQAFNIYNGLDAKYPYAAVGTQSAKELNDRVKALEEGGSGGESNLKVYSFDGDKDSEENKKMFEQICIDVDEGKNVALFYNGDLYNDLFDGRSSRSPLTFRALFLDDSGVSSTVNGVGYNVYYQRDVKYSPETRTIDTNNTKRYIIADKTSSVNQIIGKDNTTQWTPTKDYGLVHKKYVDDAINEIKNSINTLMANEEKKIEW